MCHIPRLRRLARLRPRTLERSSCSEPQDIVVSMVFEARRTPVWAFIAGVLRLCARLLGGIGLEASANRAPDRGMSAHASRPLAKPQASVYYPDHPCGAETTLEARESQTIRDGRVFMSSALTGVRIMRYGDDRRLFGWRGRNDGCDTGPGFARACLSLLRARSRKTWSVPDPSRERPTGRRGSVSEPRRPGSKREMSSLMAAVVGWASFNLLFVLCFVFPWRRL